jgi:hypothetical protein
MRRSVSLGAAGLFVAALTAFGPARPASANGACVNMAGVMVTAAPIFYPGFGPPTTTNWFAGWTVGTCAGYQTAFPSGLTLNSLSMTGVLSGWCGLSSGSGVTSDGHAFSWIEVGHKMVFTGELSGLVLGYVPDILAGDSCFSPGADQFLIGWSGFVKTHCAAPVQTKQTVPVPTTWWSWNVWTRACVVPALL